MEYKIVQADFSYIASIWSHGLPKKNGHRSGVGIRTYGVFCAGDPPKI